MKYTKLTIAAHILMMGTAFGFENTKVLPSGVRQVKIKSVNTQVETKMDGIGSLHTLGEPLTKPLTLGKILNSKKNPGEKRRC